MDSHRKILQINAASGTKKKLITSLQISATLKRCSKVHFRVSISFERIFKFWKSVIVSKILIKCKHIDLKTACRESDDRIGKGHA